MATCAAAIAGWSLAIGQVRNEREARGDRLGRIDEMLADEGFAIAESIGEHDRFAILAEDVRIGATWRVNRLDEESERQRVVHHGFPCPPGGNS